MQRFLTSHPVLTVFGLVAIYFVVIAAPTFDVSLAFGGDATRTPQSAPLSQIPLEFALAASVLAIVVLMGWSREARVTSRPDWGGLWYVLPPALMTLGILGSGIATAIAKEFDLAVLWSSGFFLKLLFFVILVGIFEEVLFRGLVLHGLEVRIGPIAALFASSALFGAMHYVNWVGGQSLSGTHAQVLHAGLSGILYGAIALRTRSVWPGVFLHALWDFTVMINGGIIGATPAVTEASSGHVTTIFGFIVKNFEPILGFVVLFGWLRWRHRNEERK